MCNYWIYGASTDTIVATAKWAHGISLAPTQLRFFLSVRAGTLCGSNRRVYSYLNIPPIGYRVEEGIGNSSIQGTCIHPVLPRLQKGV